MPDHLDEILSVRLPKGKKALKFLKLAYSSGIEMLVNRSITDKFIVESGHSFHIGTDDPHMRRIASWILTNHQNRVGDLITRLWKRNGREDVKLVGLLIANTEGDAWSIFLNLLRNREPVEVILEVVEEIKRAGREIPSAEKLEKLRPQSTIHHQAAMLIASLSPTDEYSELIQNAPKGGELFERIRIRALDA